VLLIFPHSSYDFGVGSNLLLRDDLAYEFHEVVLESGDELGEE
jgi:hypothetical protein